MSTFDGIIEQFPNIRIDYFRNHPGKPPPQACFLSHIHSDHLLGLETLKMPFVYCSAATRRILLKMEKYPHRINFSKGILEARKQTYKHLKTILRPLPLQTPVELELNPRCCLRVTLFDANHCPGAVMFLIEGDGRAILYTGDIRAELWWVNAIVRSPALIPYTLGPKRLDCIYLDTTFASQNDIYREFLTKADGLSELAKKVSKCPSNTVFYFRAWTLGYEDVWILLSSVLNSQVHVDHYQLRLFQGVSDDGLAAEPGPALTGFQLGNSEHPGCLTVSSDVKIHSCEPRTPCHTALLKNKDIVWITPIISRLRDGTEIAEIGAGGGGGDLYQKRELDLGNDAMMETLRLLCSTVAADPQATSRFEDALPKARSNQDRTMMLDGLGFDPEEEISIKDFVKMLSDTNNALAQAKSPKQLRTRSKQNVIHFPYSRHSSYTELRNLVQAFRPRDICPCTVELESWNEELSMEALFGDLCSGRNFKYDEVIRVEAANRKQDSRTTADQNESQQPVNSQLTASHDNDEDEMFRSADNMGQNRAEGNKTPPTQIMRDSDELRSNHDPVAGMVQFENAWREVNKAGSQVVHTISRAVLPYDAAVEECETTTPLNSTTDENGSDDIPLDDIDDVGPTSNRRVQITMSALDGSSDSPLLTETDSRNDGSARKKRKLAFKAAKACLDNGNTEEWTGLGIRSFGWKGHTEEEKEL